MRRVAPIWTYRSDDLSKLVVICLQNDIRSVYDYAALDLVQDRSAALHSRRTGKIGQFIVRSRQEQAGRAEQLLAGHAILAVIGFLGRLIQRINREHNIAATIKFGGGRVSPIINRSF